VCVVEGVKQMSVTKITATVRASLDSGDMDMEVTVAPRVLQGARRAILEQAIAPNAS